VHNAEVAPACARISEINDDTSRKACWARYEMKILGKLVVLNAFTRYKSLKFLQVLFIGTAASAVFPSTMLGTSGYRMSKSATAVLVQYFTAENLDISIFTMYQASWKQR
jgi:hypothetical protein